MSFEVDKVLKFGGTSVATSDRIKHVIEIIKNSLQDSQRIVVVVSALAGITDQLIAMGKAAADNSDYQKLFAEAKERHVTAAHQLIPQERLSHALKVMGDLFHELYSLLEGIYLLKELSPKTLDVVMSFGERFSAFLISEAIKSSVPETHYLDAREVIVTDRTFGEARIDFEESNKKIQDYFRKTSGLVIITGFIGSSHQNETTTLGRGGSDFTASIVGAALGAKVIEIWTDVDGVLTADPKKEEYAFSIPSMSYREAMEMSHFGAKVLHPPTITPALKKNIPLLIKNSFHPEAPGTLISSRSSKSEAQICGISSIDQVALMCLQGTGIVGVCGIAKRLFGALAEKGISVILISQGSSEHSICFAIQPHFVEAATEAIQKEFALEMQVHLIDEVALERNLSVIAVVGENMRLSPGITGNLFGALGKNGINVVAIAQGSSELNISFVIKKEDEIKAIRTIHEAFFLSPRTTLNAFVVGTGLIGTALLKQVKRHAGILLEEHAIDIRIVGLADSRHMLFDKKGIPLDDWQEAFQSVAEMMNIDLFVDRMVHFNLLNTVFVDCTSSQTVTDLYEKILLANIAIVTPNKKANSGSYDQYKKLKALAAKQKTKFLYGANVGAGLPIISTINEMLRSGDKIIKIEAILSGTMSYLFNTFTGDKPFSAVVQEAKEKGYTEPDPREDLSGMDVARKLLILARESDFPLEMEDIRVEPFLTDESLQNNDEQLARLKNEVHQESKRLCYIATLENGKGRVALQAIPMSHPFYHTKGSDNIVAITSEFYRENPLVIKGAGAGAEVTAGKVFADLVQCSQ